MRYESEVRIQSTSAPEVTYTIARISFGRRIELMKKVRALWAKLEFLRAGTSPQDRLEAALVTGEIDRMYLEWGLTSIEGLEIDGRNATPELLMSGGPEELCREAVVAIKRECALDDEERKN